MPRIALFVALAVVLAGARAVAQDKAPIYITEGKGKRYRAAVQRFRPQDPAAGRLVEEIRLDIEAGLAFSGLFESIRTEAFLESVDSPPLANKSVACPSWAQIGSDALVQGEVGAATGQVRAEFRVFDVSRGCLRMLR